MSVERWLPVVGHEGRYEVSSLGRVQSLDRTVQISPSKQSPTGHSVFAPGQLLRPGRASNGYLTVTIDGKSWPVQWLVAAAFIGPRPDGLLVLHGDGNRQNNADWNLCYGTHEDNAADALLHGRRTRGERFSSAKLTDLSAAAVRALKGRWPQSELALLFGVSPAAVQAVHDGRTWKHVVPLTVIEALDWLTSFGPLGTIEQEVEDWRYDQAFPNARRELDRRQMDQRR